MVTGDPADDAFLGAQVRAAIDRVVRPSLPPGARFWYGTMTPALQILAVGFETDVSVPVSVQLADGSTTNGVVPVHIQNLDVMPFVPQTLYLDDDPEYLAGNGVVFSGTVDAGHATRLYYYHENTLAPRTFGVILSADVPTRVHLIDAAAGPNVDVMSVGHAVSRSVLQYTPANEGIVVDVPASLPFVERVVTLAAGDGVAGSLGIKVLSGGPVKITIVAAPTDAHVLGALDQPRLAGDGHNRHGAFALTGFGDASLTYTVGGPDVSTVYGTREVSPQNIVASDPGRDIGDYGVLHHIVFQISNPTPAAATVYLYERPLGGAVRSSFLIDGALREIGCARLPNRYAIGSYDVPANGSASAQITTMTDGGSNYPLEIGMTTSPVAPTTPPMTSAEGCFPKPEGPSPFPSMSPSPAPSPSPQATSASGSASNAGLPNK